MTHKLVHQHLLVRAHVSKPMETVEQSNAFLHELIKRAGMRTVIEPRSVIVTTPGNEGPTGTANLSTSHVAVHSWPQERLIQFDLYSCKCFDAHKVISILDPWDPIGYEAMVIMRDADGFKVTDHWAWRKSDQ